MSGTCIKNVGNSVPLVHNITNSVTVNDAANALLACGAKEAVKEAVYEVQ